MQLAYGIDTSQIANRPGWLDNTYLDINAKPEVGGAVGLEDRGEAVAGEPVEEFGEDELKLWLLRLGDDGYRGHLEMSVPRGDAMVVKQRIVTPSWREKAGHPDLRNSQPDFDQDHTLSNRRVQPPSAYPWTSLVAGAS